MCWRGKQHSCESASRGDSTYLPGADKQSRALLERWCIWSSLSALLGWGWGEEVAFALAVTTMGSGRSLFFPTCMREGMIDVEVEAVPPSVSADWMLAAVFGEVRKCNLSSVEISKVVFFFGEGGGLSVE